MNEITVFENEMFGKVRIIDFDGKPYAVAKDIAEILGYSNPLKAIRDHCKGVNESFIPSNGGNQLAKIIPEGDIYRLIVRSKLPNAENFESWVMDIVLPQIRKTGGYIPVTAEMSDTEIMAKALMVAQRTLKKKDELISNQNRQLEEQKPKVLIAEAISGSDSTILVGDLAKILKQNGIDTGQNRLFTWLRENGYLIKRRGINRNMPTQRSMEMGLFEIREKPIQRESGTKISKTTLVTGKGQAYFIGKFLEG